MKKKRFIFDLDGTLLSADFSIERLYFQKLFDSSAYLINDKIVEYLEIYERIHEQYDEERLGKFLSKKTGLDITKSVIEGWIDIMADVPDEKEEGIIELLEYLKEKGHSLAVLTNWFGNTQIPRLERSGLISYFDDIYTGEQGLKPHQISYQSAISMYDASECIMIGDNLEKDYIGPRTININSILYDKNNNHGKQLVKVKKMTEVIKKYEEE